MAILTRDEIQQLNECSLEILSTVGVKLNHAEVFKRLIQAGADGDESERLARLPRKLVEDCLARCPRVVKLSDLNGNLTELPPSTIFWPGNALYLVEGKQRREITSKDFVNLTRLNDSLEHVHAMVGTSISDYPPPTRDFVGFRLMAENTCKHLRPCIFTAKGAEAIIKMAEVLLDGKSLREYPIFSLGYTAVSPLQWSETALELFLNTSGRGIPMMINAEPMAGGTAPVTLAGCLTLANAEALSGIVITQTLEPGRPCVFNLGFSHTLDMRSLIALSGGAEDGLLAAAGAEIAQFHGLPSASWMSTESMLADAQASLEKMLTGLQHALSHVNIIWGVGQLESQMSLSLEQSVIDNEIAKMILRAQSGIKVNPETLALDVIKEVGCGGKFLDIDHTLRHFREEITYPNLINRKWREDWEAEGAKSLLETAAEKVKDILKAHKEAYLTDKQQAELLKIEAKWMDDILN